MAYIDHFSRIHSLCERGINYVSALHERIKIISISSRSGQDIQINESFDLGTGFHLITENVDGFLSINNVDSIDIELYNLSEKLMRGKSHSGTVRIPSNVIKHRVDSNDILSRPRVSNIREIEVIKYIGSLIRGFDPSIRYNINLEINDTTKTFQSSEGIDITQKILRNLLTVEIFSLITKVRLNIVIGGINQECLDLDLIEHRVNQLLIDFSAISYNKYPSSGRYNAVLNPDTSFSLIHESIGHGVEADQVITGNSFLAGSRGYPVSSSLLNITDDPNIKSNGWLVYDDEGVKSQGTQIVEEGILVNFLHNKKTAKLMQTHTTGNARATSYLSPPEPRQTNLYIEPGDLSLEEMLEELGTGLLIGSSLSANTSIYTGSYNIQAQNSHWVENGEIIQTLGPLNIADYAINSLQAITSVGKEVETIPSLCLKGDSRIFIGGIAPHLLVEDILVR